MNLSKYRKDLEPFLQSYHYQAVLAFIETLEPGDLGALLQNEKVYRKTEKLFNAITYTDQYDKFYHKFMERRDKFRELSPTEKYLRDFMYEFILGKNTFDKTNPYRSLIRRSKSGIYLGTHVEKLRKYLSYKRYKDHKFAADVICSFDHWEFASLIEKLLTPRCERAFELFFLDKRGLDAKAAANEMGTSVNFFRSHLTAGMSTLIEFIEEDKKHLPIELHITTVDKSEYLDQLADLEKEVAPRESRFDPYIYRILVHLGKYDRYEDYPERLEFVLTDRAVLDYAVSLMRSGLEKSAFIAYFKDGKKTKEIAEERGVTRATINANLRHALRVLANISKMLKRDIRESCEPLRLTLREDEYDHI